MPRLVICAWHVVLMTPGAGERAKTNGCDMGFAGRPLAREAHEQQPLGAPQSPVCTPRVSWQRRRRCEVEEAATATRVLFGGTSLRSTKPVAGCACVTLT